MTKLTTKALIDCKRRALGISGPHEPLRMKDLLNARPLHAILKFRLRAKFMLLEPL
ncbi:MAG TPA: hypothetical protein VGQ39_24555 [Pyrinomonadaceae bacterium]|jgi:hypothetical protein|nr:hypothetical protein [Pyrinomonadaceae bacterium]